MSEILYNKEQANPQGYESIMIGLSYKVNKNNPYAIIRLHWSADEEKRDSVKWQEVMKDTFPEKWQRKQEYEVVHNARSGRKVFGLIDPLVHIIDYENVPEDLTWFLGGDYGNTLKNPTHVTWFGFDKDNNCYCMMEYRAFNCTLLEHSKNIIARNNNIDYRFFAIDNTTNRLDRKDSDVKTVYNEFIACGVERMVLASRLYQGADGYDDGRRLIRDRLKNALNNYNNDLPKTDGLYLVRNRVPILYNEIKSHSFTKDCKFDDNDDAIDGLRYVLTCGARYYKQSSKNDFGKRRMIRKMRIAP